ncbi:hypothetical protein BDN71DRAFT_1502384 [Pleurotus eryngii]|uniref:F-box domain-containing protein n=1 Tax=Pleurotus eryngii TaxID=5323 RepID=A0A9P6DBC2_PLEER|nr:hypothetical protein BDN71DRAFT_1502384 [Pleurotus eryngii]
MTSSCLSRFVRLAPIDSLPVEIISHIFILSASEDRNKEQQSGFDSSCITMPLVLSSVNHRWRRVAVTTPALWANLCLTPDFVVDSTGELDTKHLTDYLQRSRKSPLRICIDVRDPEWDFTEDGVTVSHSEYQPTFTSKHMSQALALLVPHLFRWRSVSVFTDTWALMHAALSQLSPAIITCGAPLLESLILMRCNDFVSFSESFQPGDLKQSPLFRNCGTGTSEDGKAILPRLRHLTLKGVHADWPSLSSVLSSTLSLDNDGLYSLELSSHTLDVRPDLPTLHSILSSSPHLRQLTITGSGFRHAEGLVNASISRHHESTSRVCLPELRQLHLGYRSVPDGCKFVDMIDAPQLESLSLRNDSHPADSAIVDAGPVLEYVGSGTTSLPSSHPSAPLPSSPVENTVVDGEPPFPRIETIVLDRVEASESQFRTFFDGLPKARSLELRDTPLVAMQCLLPSRPHRQGIESPCPSLQSLALYTSDALTPSGASLRLCAFLGERARSGAGPLKDLSVYLDSDSSFCAEEESILTTVCGTKIRVYEALSEDADWLTCVGDEEESAFKLGGAFNDPIFDSYHSGHSIGVAR